MKCKHAYVKFYSYCILLSSLVYFIVFRYQRNENRNDLMQRKFLNSKTSTATSASPVASYRQMGFQPPYLTHHVVENNINTTDSSHQREQRSPFFVTNEVNNFPHFDNRGNSFQTARNDAFNQNIRVSLVYRLFKPIPFN